MKAYLFHESIWKCFEGELPVKPEPVEDWETKGGLKIHVGGDFGYSKALTKYNKKIATLKASALPVGNPEIIKVSPEELRWNLGYDFYEWAGTIEKKTTSKQKVSDLDMELGRVPMGTIISELEYVYILHLPKADEPISEDLKLPKLELTYKEFVPKEELDKVKEVMRELITIAEDMEIMSIQEYSDYKGSKEIEVVIERAKKLIE